MRRTSERWLVIGAMAALITAMVIVPGCAAPPRLSGERCLFSDECNAGLLCVGGYCRVECRTDLDCSNAWRCRSAGVPDKSVCLDGRATHCLYHSQCGANELCTRDGLCRIECRTTADCPPMTPASRCVENACRAPGE